MYRVSEFTKQSYKTGEVAKILNVTTKTVQNYDKWGKLKVCRTEGDRRCIMREDLLDFLRSKGLLIDDAATLKRDVIYLNVAPSDDSSKLLTNLLEHTKQVNNPMVLIDNEGDDKAFMELMGQLLDSGVNKLYIYDTVVEKPNFKYIMLICDKLNVVVEKVSTK